MTTPSGPIGLGHVQTEFGGSNPIGLSEYYRGGAYVPSGTVAGTSGVQIATTGAIRLGDFRGVQAAHIVTPLTLNMVVADGLANQTAWINFYSDGDVKSYTTGNVLNQDTSWYFPDPTAGIGSSYWIRATLTSGTTPSSGSGVGTWLQLNAVRSWTNTRTTVGTKTSTLLIEIASDSGGSNIVTSGSVVITAFKDA